MNPERVMDASKKIQSSAPGRGVMSSNSFRLGLAVMALILLWVVVYWMTPAPSVPHITTPAITFGESPTDVTEELLDDGPMIRDGSVASEQVIKSPPLTGPLVEVPQDIASRPEVAVIPPAYTMYRVQSGDSMQSIASAKYGAMRYWQSISKMNPDVDPSRLRKGQLLRLPVDPNNFQGLAVDAAQDAPPEQPEYTEYIVGKGDTLTGIAKSLYGRASLWTVIRDANSTKVDRNGTNIRPGMVLRIPPPPDAAR